MVILIFWSVTTAFTTIETPGEENRQMCAYLVNCKRNRWSERRWKENDRGLTQVDKKKKKMKKKVWGGGEIARQSMEPLFQRAGDLQKVNEIIWMRNAYRGCSTSTGPTSPLVANLIILLNIFKAASLFFKTTLLLWPFGRKIDILMNFLLWKNGFYCFFLFFLFMRNIVDEHLGELV